MCLSRAKVVKKQTEKQLNNELLWDNTDIRIGHF